MLFIERVGHAFGPRTVLRDVSCTVNPGEVVGLVGPNGSGKSTLLSIVRGALRPDAGRARFEGRLAYVEQAPERAPDETAAVAFPTLFPDAAADALQEVAARLALPDLGAEEERRLQLRYDAILQAMSAPPEDALTAPGLGSIGPETPLASLSGGERTKLALTAALRTHPDVLLLDEPTNHLDIDGVRWLEGVLARFEGAAIVVSHDRALLDAVVDGVLVLSEADTESDGSNGEFFRGSYSEWADERQRRVEEQWMAYGRQQREERRFKEHISKIESRSRHIENSTIDFAIRKKALKIARRAVTLKARLQREAASEEHVERPVQAAHGVQATFGTPDRSAHRLLELRDASIAVAPATTPLLSHLDLALERGDRIALLGANGSGKTTLVRTILGEIEPAVGEVALAGSAHVGYLSQFDEPLAARDGIETPLDLVRSQTSISQVEAGNFLHRVFLGHEQATAHLATLTPGEGRRLALALLMLEGANLLLLDEPTNHLDLPSKESFEAALRGFEGATLLVTHDRYLVERWATGVWSVEGGRIVEASPDAQPGTIAGGS